MSEYPPDKVIHSHNRTFWNRSVSICTNIQSAIFESIVPQKNPCHFLINEIHPPRKRRGFAFHQRYTNHQSIPKIRASLIITPVKEFTFNSFGITAPFVLFVCFCRFFDPCLFRVPSVAKIRFTPKIRCAVAPFRQRCFRPKSSRGGGKVENQRCCWSLVSHCSEWPPPQSCSRRDCGNGARSG